MQYTTNNNNSNNDNNISSGEKRREAGQEGTCLQVPYFVGHWRCFASQRSGLGLEHTVVLETPRRSAFFKTAKCGT